MREASANSLNRSKGRALGIVVSVLLVILAVDLIENTWKGLRQTLKYVAGERPVTGFPVWEPDDRTELAAWLKAHSEPEDTVFIVGYGTPVYFLSERKCATPWIYVIRDSLGYRFCSSYEKAAYEQWPESVDPLIQLHDLHFREVREESPRFIIIDQKLCGVPFQPIPGEKPELVMPQATYNRLEREYTGVNKFGPYLVFRHRSKGIVP